jgi:uncharacterized protein YbaR (Trm112 family)
MKTFIALIICPYCEITLGLPKLASGRPPKTLTCPECRSVYTVAPPESSDSMVFQLQRKET